MLGSLSGSVTSFVGDHGVYAVFALLALAAVFPAASELTMLYAGAVAGGAFAGVHVGAFGHAFGSGAGAYVALTVAGVLGNLVGAAVGWTVGFVGGRPLVHRYGRVLHADEAKLDRAERWFERFGEPAVLLGFATPVVRSFVAIPAGIFEMPLVRFLPFAFLGCAVFCFGLAGAGWALGSSYAHARGYADVAAAVVVVAVLAYAVLRWRRRRSSRLAARARDPSH